MSQSRSVSSSAHIVWPEWATNKRKKPVESISVSFARQWYRIRIGIQEYDVIPVSEVPQEFSIDSETLYFLSAWSPAGAHQDVVENQELSRELQSELDKSGFRYHHSVTLQANLGWFESSFAVNFPTDLIAREWAKKFGQPAVVKWEGRSLQVLHIDDSNTDSVKTPCSVILVEKRLCPLKCQDRDSMCSTYGGPWTSSSMNALVTWSEHRANLLQLVGCDICDDGKKQLPGKLNTTNSEQYLNRRGTLIANRYGGYVC